jgi:glycosyltransferase involved in cell wall biosynthesis
MMAEAGVPLVIWPDSSTLGSTRLGQLLAAILLTLPYAVLRGRNLRASWTAAQSIFLTRLVRRERARMRRDLDLFTKGGPTVLHVWGPAGLTPFLLEWAHERDVPSIYHEMGEADEVYVRTWRLEPTIATLHRAHAVVCCSDTVAGSIRRVYGYGGPILSIPFMIADPGDGWTRASKGGGRFTFGTIGRLVPHKRIDDLLQVLRRLLQQDLDVGLVIAGHGPMRPSLEAKVNELGLRAHVHFTGEFEDVARIMAMIDVLVIASSSESQSMPLTEAMSFGKPVVAVRFGGMPDFVEDGANGLLVPLADVPSLTDAIRRLMESAALRAELGRRGRERYLRQYAADHITGAFEQLYDSLASAPSRTREAAVRRTSSSIPPCP